MSNQTSKKGGEMLRLAVVLFAITFVTALLLGFVNQVTAPQIELNNEKTRAAAMAELIPDAEFTALEDPAPSEDKAVPSIKNVYKATKGGEDVGYCMEVYPSGFGGTLTVVVGVGTDGTIAGAKVTKHAETPGLGAKSQADPTWITQYTGMPADGSLAVTKDGGSVTPITGATITSRAVTLAVNTAATYAASLA